MKAAYIHQIGAPDVIQVGDISPPALAGGQVLIRVLAVSVNPIDTYVRSAATLEQSGDLSGKIVLTVP
jgi:NADPH2:quinone reductase